MSSEPPPTLPTSGRRPNVTKRRPDRRRYAGIPTGTLLSSPS